MLKHVTRQNTSFNSNKRKVRIYFPNPIWKVTIQRSSSLKQTYHFIRVVRNLEGKCVKRFITRKGWNPLLKVKHCSVILLLTHVFRCMVDSACCTCTTSREEQTRSTHIYHLEWRILTTRVCKLGPCFQTKKMEVNEAQNRPEMSCVRHTIAFCL